MATKTETVPGNVWINIYIYACNCLYIWYMYILYIYTGCMTKRNASNKPCPDWGGTNTPYKFATTALISSFFHVFFPSLSFSKLSAFKHTLRDSLHGNNKEIILNHCFATMSVFAEVSLFGVNLHGLSMGLGVQSRFSGWCCYRVCYSFAATPTNTECNVKHVTCVHEPHASRVSVTWCYTHTYNICVCVICVCVCVVPPVLTVVQWMGHIQYERVPA